MEKSLSRIFNFWQNQFTQFQRLQIVYIITLILSLVVAGLISLLNQTAGQAVLLVSKVSGMALVANSVVNSFLPRERQPKSRSKQK